MRYAIVCLMLSITPSVAGWCENPSSDDCWSTPQVRARAPEVRGWVRHAKPEPRVIIKREVVIRHVERPHDDMGRDRSDDRPGACKPPVEVLSDNMKTWKNGHASARKQWMEAVRWKYGERYMEHRNARDVFFQCNRTSAPATEGVIGEKVSEETHTLKCEIRATPCAAPIEREKSEDK